MARSKKEFDLPKHEILRGKNSFQKIFKLGTLISGYHVSITFLKADTKKVGFAVTRKIKQAVLRNRYKRLMREVYRLNKAKFPDKIHIILFAKGKSDHFEVLQKEILKLVEKISCI